MITLGLCLRISPVFLLIYLIFQLQIPSYVREKKDHQISRTAFEIFKIYKQISSILNLEAYPDKSGMYKIIPIKRNLNNQTSFDVTYVTQCSWNNFHAIGDLLEAWQGPLSVAVYAELRFVDEVLWGLSAAAYCNRFKELDITLVLPFQEIYVLSRSYAVDKTKDKNESHLCNAEYAIDDKDTRNYNWSTPYPVNLLRNVAKSRSATDYILIADVDMLPSKNLRRNFLRYMWSRKNHPKKVAFVVPAFEMLSGTEMPQTKTEIIAQSQKGNFRPFYFLPCRKCQLKTNLTKWFSYPDLPGIRTLYKVEWSHPWEPFYITYRDAPNYDERFKQYGYNRVSQICQMHIAGYSFLVLDNAFLVHKGFKSMVDFHHTKNLEMISNRKLYEQFKEEMKSKYPNSSRRCGS